LENRTRHIQEENMTKKEHQRNLRRIAKTIEKSRVLLEKARLPVEDLEARIQKNQKKRPIF
jgi:hypothetical protein